MSVIIYLLCVWLIQGGGRCDYTRVLFFFKQKTSYEMRISDCSSDVCSSDLLARGFLGHVVTDDLHHRRLEARLGIGGHRLGDDFDAGEIGRAPCRERVCQYV